MGKRPSPLNSETLFQHLILHGQSRGVEPSYFLLSHSFLGLLDIWWFVFPDVIITNISTNLLIWRTGLLKDILVGRFIT